VRQKGAGSNDQASALHIQAPVKQTTAASLIGLSLPKQTVYRINQLPVSQWRSVEAHEEHSVVNLTDSSSARVPFERD